MLGYSPQGLKKVSEITSVTHRMGGRGIGCRPTPTCGRPSAQDLRLTRSLPFTAPEDTLEPTGAKKRQPQGLRLGCMSRRPGFQGIKGAGYPETLADRQTEGKALNPWGHNPSWALRPSVPSCPCPSSASCQFTASIPDAACVSLSPLVTCGAVGRNLEDELLGKVPSRGPTDNECDVGVWERA